MSEDAVLDLVQAHLDQHQPKDYHLDVSRQGARTDSGWWYIVVQPSKDDIWARDYRDVMEQVEDELEAQENLKVLLVPVLPGD